MVEIVAVALGSGLGTMARFAVSRRVQRGNLAHPLIATLLVNLSGAGLAGALAGALDPSRTLVTSFLLTGLVGSYTTVSSLSIETLELWQSARRARAVAYVFVTLSGGLLLAWAGWSLGKGAAA